MKIEEGTSNEDFRGRKDVRKIREKNDDHIKNILVCVLKNISRYVNEENEEYSIMW
jgi:hypothetical protein